MHTDERQLWNASRVTRSTTKGHYESYFQRANHPSKPQAFWIRYTLFCPRGKPYEAICELWAIVFDGDAPEGKRIVATKEEHPIAESTFSATRFDVRIRDSHLDEATLQGSAVKGSHSIAWELRYTSPLPMISSIPVNLLEGPFPKGKVLVGSPLAVYDGTLVVDGQTIDIDGWIGSQNHNWGSQHLDAYGYCQVAGFDGRPDVFLDCGVGRVKIGPLWTPRFAVASVQIGSELYALNTLTQALRAKGKYRFFEMVLDSADAKVRISVRVRAPAANFVGLTYYNPPGGTKTCLNTKIGACELTVQPRGQQAQTFTTAHRAAFEIITDRSDHGVDMLT